MWQKDVEDRAARQRGKDSCLSRSNKMHMKYLKVLPVQGRRLTLGWILQNDWGSWAETCRTPAEQLVSWPPWSSGQLWNRKQKLKPNLQESGFCCATTRDCNGTVIEDPVHVEAVGRAGFVVSAAADVRTQLSGPGVVDNSGIGAADLVWVKELTQ